MRHTLIALVEDRPGALNRILGLLRGRGLGLHSIAVGDSETPGVKRTTVLVDTESVEQTMKQLNRLVEVLEVTDVTNAEYVVRETALVKIQVPEPRREEIRTVADVFGARIVGSSPHTVVVEMTDTPDRLGQMIARVMAIGACETMRSGSLAMPLGGPARRAKIAGPEDANQAWWSQADGIS
jgi:acetolactate synthase-1/3 small subunit